MIDLSIEFCEAVKTARKMAKIGQTELSEEVGCKQSALSMFENGGITKLNDEVIERLARRFDISLDEYRGVKEADLAIERSDLRTKVVVHSVKAFCPNPHCPTNHPYEVEGRMFYKPHREEADPVGGRFCAVCGEVLEHKCPNCGVPVHEGAICSLCGEPYVVV